MVLLVVLYDVKAKGYTDDSGDSEGIGQRYAGELRGIFSGSGWLQMVWEPDQASTTLEKIRIRGFKFRKVRDGVEA